MIFQVNYMCLLLKSDVSFFVDTQLAFLSIKICVEIEKNIEID